MIRLRERLAELYEVTGGSSCCGYMYDPVAMLLYSLVKFYRPEVVIQTGHLWGKSALVALEAMTDGFELQSERQNSDPKFTAFVEAHTPEIPARPLLISIDPAPAGVPRWRVGVDVLRSWYPENFKFFNTTSQEFFERNWNFADESAWKKGLFGIVDGDHSIEGCAYDIKRLKKLNASIIFVDDVEWIPHICQVARDESLKNFPDYYSFYHFHGFNGVGLLVRNA